MLTILTGERRVEVEWEGHRVAFTLAPENLESQLEAMNWAQQHGLVQEDFGPVSLFSFSRIDFLRRTKAWEGIGDAAGQLLPCTEEMKILVFGQQPGLILALMEKYQADLETERKNSGTSPPG